jgi:hypothetical protein
VERAETLRGEQRVDARIGAGGEPDAERELGSALGGLAERDAIDIAGAWIVWMEGLAHDAS